MNRLFRGFLFGWSLWNLLPPAASVLIAIGARAQWDPRLTGRTPAFGSTASLEARLTLAVHVSYGFCVMAATYVVIAGLLVLPRQVAGVWVALTTSVALLCGAAPVVSRVIIPAEDPYTGTGSPLASLMSVACFGLGGAILFTLPGMVLLVLGLVGTRPRTSIG